MVVTGSEILSSLARDVEKFDESVAHLINNHQEISSFDQNLKTAELRKKAYYEAKIYNFKNQSSGTGGKIAVNKDSLSVGMLEFIFLPTAKNFQQVEEEINILLSHSGDISRKLEKLRHAVAAKIKKMSDEHFRLVENRRKLEKAEAERDKLTALSPDCNDIRVLEHSNSQIDYRDALHAVEKGIRSEYGIWRYSAIALFVLGFDAVVNFNIMTVLGSEVTTSLIMAGVIALLLAIACHTGGANLKEGAQIYDGKGIIKKRYYGPKIKKLFSPFSFTRLLTLGCILMALMLIVVPRLSLFDPSLGISPSWESIIGYFTGSGESTPSGGANLSPIDPSSVMQDVLNSSQPSINFATLGIGGPRDPWFNFVLLLGINFAVLVIGMSNSWKFHDCFSGIKAIRDRYLESKKSIQDGIGELDDTIANLRREIEFILKNELWIENQLWAVSAQFESANNMLNGFDFSPENIIYKTKIDTAIRIYKMYFIKKLYKYQSSKGFALINNEKSKEAIMMNLKQYTNKELSLNRKDIGSYCSSIPNLVLGISRLRVQLAEYEEG